MNKNWVYVVMSEDDYDGGLPEYTVQVFASREQAFAHAQELRDEYFTNISIMERELIDRRVGERRKPEGTITFTTTRKEE